jgi:histone acetyltransferase (RNA polymerase elongator complex component)
LPSVSEIRDRIRSFLGTFNGRARRREVAFYGGSFTALRPVEQESLLRAVRPFVEERMIDGLRVSTRPDAIDRSRLDLLWRYNVETVELGAQSMVDRVLKTCERGHSSGDVVRSVGLLRSMGFEVGIQIMLGLPGEDMDLFLTTVRRVIDLAPDCVRIYPLLVLSGSPLEGLYRKGSYAPIPLLEAVRWAKEALRRFEQARIPVIRMGLQATPELEDGETIVAGPFHPAFRSLVESSIFYDMACRLLEAWGMRERQRARFQVAPEDLAHLKGERKENVTRLRDTHALESVEVISDPRIPQGSLVLETDRGDLVVSREDLEIESLLRYGRSLSVVGGAPERGYH